MPAIPLAKGYNKRSQNQPVRLFNMFFEADPTNLKDQVALLSRAGLDPVGSAGAGFIAGLIRREDTNDSVVGVSGEFFFAVTPDGTVTMGSGGIVGSTRVRMATDGSNTMIVRSGAIYCKPLSGAVATIAMPDDRAAYDVVFLASRFWIASEDGRVYFTNPGETTVDALNYFTAETSPDALIGVGVDGDQLVLFGRSSIEWYYMTSDVDLPAQRIQGRRSTAGLASVYSLATTDAGLAWVGDDGIVYRSGDLPIPISDPSIAEAVRRARPRINTDDPATTMSGWSFALEQHAFYVLDLPGEGSFAYDFATNQWSEFGTVDQPLFLAGCGAKQADGRWIVGSTFSSDIHAIDPDTYDDAGAPLVRRFPGLTRTDQNLRFSNVQVDCSVGGAGLDYPGDNPKLAMHYSDDVGKTWVDWSYASLGRQGSRQKPRFKFPRGQRPGTRIWEWRMSDAIPFTAHGATYNEPVV